MTSLGRMINPYGISHNTSSGNNTNDSNNTNGGNDNSNEKLSYWNQISVIIVITTFVWQSRCENYVSILVSALVVGQILFDKDMILVDLYRFGLKWLFYNLPFHIITKMRDRMLEICRRQYILRNYFRFDYVLGRYVFGDSGEKFVPHFTDKFIYPIYEKCPFIISRDWILEIEQPDPLPTLLLKALIYYTVDIASRLILLLLGHLPLALKGVVLFFTAIQQISKLCTVTKDVIYERVQGIFRSKRCVKSREKMLLKLLDFATLTKYICTFSLEKLTVFKDSVESNAEKIIESSKSLFSTYGKRTFTFIWTTMKISLARRLNETKAISSKFQRKKKEESDVTECKQQNKIKISVKPDLFYHACYHGHADLVKQLLVHYKSDFIISDFEESSGFTAFHLACAGGHTTVVEQLLQEFDVCNFLQNRDGITGLEVAIQMSQIHVVNAILESISRQDMR
jgi:hypothetical protein